MLKGPKIKLSVDLHKLDKYFPMDMHLKEGFDYDWIIDRDHFNKVAAMLNEYRITDEKRISEFCFIFLWLEKETQAGEERGNLQGKFYRMQAELDQLHDYFLRFRITSITLKGEIKKHSPGEEFTITEDIIIDRICDGIRHEFQEDFKQDKEKRRTKGLKEWQRRKMVKIRNKILNYFASVPELDSLSLEDQNDLIEKISILAGLT